MFDLHQLNIPPMPPVKPPKEKRYSSTEEYLLHRIQQLEEEVEMLREYIKIIEETSEMMK